MVPFFPIKIKKGKDYCIFNPVNNKKYTVSYSAYRILEQCDGMHTIEEIADTVVSDFRKTKPEVINYVTGFLDEMYRNGMITWREADIKECSSAIIIVLNR